MQVNHRREKKRMKKEIRSAFSMLIIGCILLGTGAIVKASEPGYVVMEAYDTAPVTLDGNWATGEWEDSWIEWLNYSTNGERFCYKASSALEYGPEILIDSSDNTTDAGDIWQVCIGVVDGAAPTSGQNKIEIVGHETLTVYAGDGEDWVVVDDSPVTWADNMTIHDAPLDYEHYCVEMIIDKATLNSAWNAAPPIGLRVAMYDESNDTWLAWPPESDPDVPDTWGEIQGGAASIPDSWSLISVVLLSSVAVAVAVHSMRKRTKNVNFKL
jgi:hypothetical protein